MKGEKQIRMTLDDCCNAQESFRQVISTLIKEKRPLDNKERAQYFKLIPKALLSQGTEHPHTFMLYDTIVTFESFQTFAKRLARMESKGIKMETKYATIAVPIEVLWKKLEDNIEYQFQLATSQAIEMSKEMPKREIQDATSFTSKEVL